MSLIDVLFRRGTTSLNRDAPQVLPELIPEQRLIIAVMEGAIRELLREPCRAYQAEHKRRRSQISARRWVYATGLSPFSLEWCCFYLDIDAEKLRNLLIMEYQNWRIRFKGANQRLISRANVGRSKPNKKISHVTLKAWQRERSLSPLMT